MQKQTDYASIWSFVAMCLIAVVGIGMLVTPLPQPATAEDISTKVLAGVTIPTAEEIAAAVGSNEEILAILNEDDNWETAATVLATEELYDNFDRLANKMTQNINEDDIYNVVIRETEVTNANVDDKDAKVYFKLYVNYDDGTDRNWDRRATVYVSITIDDDDAKKLKVIDNPGVFD